LEIARERTPPEAAARVTRSLDDVDRQLVEVDAILGDLLASARAGLADLRSEPRELASWVEERAAAENTGPVEVVVEGARSITVEIDPALLGRALHNVLANAWAHGHPKDQPLVVTLSADEACARVSVRDQGPGFAADILPRAFEPFVTGTGAARSPKAHGIGLGLALVRRIVEAHGGRVSAENVEAGGAVVTFDLPRART
jgi:signal transduction histidine kinase